MQELHKEEAESNTFLLDYYAKINNLRDLKMLITRLQARNEEMKEEQMREEKLLTKKEVEFHIIDRLGLLLLLQRYYQNRLAHKTQPQLLQEFQTLKQYFFNIEIFQNVGN